MKHDHTLSEAQSPIKHCQACSGPHRCSSSALCSQGSRGAQQNTESHIHQLHLGRSACMKGKCNREQKTDSSPFVCFCYYLIWNQLACSPADILECTSLRKSSWSHRLPKWNLQEMLHYLQLNVLLLPTSNSNCYNIYLYPCTLPYHKLQRLQQAQFHLFTVWSEAEPSSGDEWIRFLEHRFWKLIQRWSIFNTRSNKAVNWMSSYGQDVLQLNTEPNTVAEYIWKTNIRIIDKMLILIS